MLSVSSVHITVIRVARAFLYEGWKSVGFGLIFCTKQLSTVGPVREGVDLKKTISYIAKY